MKRLQKTLMYLFIATAVAFTSCSPEDGADGMDGAPGEQGVAGQDGEDGEDGQDGADGSADFIFSNWIDIELEAGASSFDDVAAGEITQEIRDTYGVLMYGKLTSNVIPLPYSEGVQNYSYFFRSDVNALRVYCSTTDNSSYPWNNMTQVRYILIPPPEGRSSETFNLKEVIKYFKSKGLDVSNYTEVQAYFKLQE